MKFVVIYNSKSGSALPLTDLKKMFADAKLPVVAYVSIGKNIVRRLRPYCKKNITVAVIGGDGTISSIVSIIQGSGAILAPLPGGTLNHFTKDLGIAQDLPTAIANLAKAKSHSIDIGKINDKVFLNNSSIGIYPSSLQTRKVFENQLSKWPAAIVGGIRAFIQFQNYNVTINNTVYRTPFIFIGNNKYDLNNNLSRTNLAGGKLSVYIIKSDKRTAILKLIALSLISKPRSADELIEFFPEQFTIESKRRRMKIAIDGELCTVKTPIRYRSLARSLTII